jgi:hypothetical protein
MRFKWSLHGTVGLWPTIGFLANPVSEEKHAAEPTPGPGACYDREMTIP